MTNAKICKLIKKLEIEKSLKHKQKETITRVLCQIQTKINKEK